jgi:hypothetical protein
MADPEASIVVVAKHNPMSFLLNMTKFVLEIDGDTQVGSWGERVVGVAPGAHSVRMWFRYLGRECGVAAVSVNTTGGDYASHLLPRSHLRLLARESVGRAVTVQGTSGSAVDHDPGQQRLAGTARRSSAP